MRDEPILVLDPDAAELVAALRARAPAEAQRFLACPSPDALTTDAALARICLGTPDAVRAAAERLPELRWIQSTWAGIRPLLPLLAERPELQLTGVKDIFGPLMSEYVFGWILALERRLFDYAVQQQAGVWRQLPLRRFCGRHLVVLGTGSIGHHIATVGGALGLTVSGVSRSGRAVVGIDEVHPVARLAEAVEGADYLVSVVPDTAETRNLIDRRVLAALAPGAVLVNVGRGSAVVDADLVAVLTEGRLGAAVLDVFREEPLPVTHPFWTTPNLHLTPHVAAETLADDIAGLFLTNLARWQAGDPLAHLVDPAHGY